MSGPIGYMPGLRRPIVKCPADGLYVEDRFQVVMQPGWVEGEPHACRHCGALVPWEYEQPSHEPPDCPAGCGPLGTPITDSNGDFTTDHWDGPPEANLWCPLCGRGWVASHDDVAVADRCWQAENKEPTHAL